MYLKPRRCASRGIVPPPANGSRIGGGFRLWIPVISLPCQRVVARCLEFSQVTTLFPINVCSRFRSCDDVPSVGTSWMKTGHPTNCVQIGQGGEEPPGPTTKSGGVAVADGFLPCGFPLIVLSGCRLQSSLRFKFVTRCPLVGRSVPAGSAWWCSSPQVLAQLSRPSVAARSPRLMLRKCSAM